MTRTDVATGGDLRDLQTPVLTLNLVERPGHDRVHAHVPQSLDEKTLEHVNALLWCVQLRFLTNEFAKPRVRVQPDTTTDDGMRGNPGQDKRHAWTQSNADQNRRRPESPLLRADERTAQEPSRRSALLQLDGNGGAAVGHDVDRRLSLRCDDPEASDV